MDNKIMVTNENNVLEEVEIIDFFQLEEYDHEYVLYTKNEEVDNNIVIYVSIVNQISNDAIKIKIFSFSFKGSPGLCFKILFSSYDFLYMIA